MNSDEVKYVFVNPAARDRIESCPDHSDLPTLPAIFTRLQNAIQDPSTDAADVAKIIENDQSLTLRLLKTVNSAAFGLNSKVDSVERAIALLGFDEVSQIVLAASLIQSSPQSSKGRPFNMEKFWKHCIGVGVSARVLAQHIDGLPKDIRQSTFTAGLVHDIGKLVMLQLFEDDFARAMDVCRMEKCNLLSAEKIIFDFNHCDAGSYLLDIWNMPRNMVKAVELHHSPEDLVIEDESFLFVALVHIADALTHFLEIGSGGDPFIPEVSEQAWRTLAIPEKDVPRVLNTIQQAYQEVYKVIFS